MSMKEAYKQKIEAELELLQAKFSEFKARTKIHTADARIQYAEQIDKIEIMMNATKTKLKELGDAGEGAWEVLKDGIESTWSSLKASVRETSTKKKMRKQTTIV